MNLITTYSGIKFNPIDPSLEDVSINDIAHALSFMTRANGHCKYFYSVAQHSINCSLESKARGYSKKIQLACLLHDGSEAYMADIVRPCKVHLTQYLALENKLQNTIWNALGIHFLTTEEYDSVFKIDDIILYNEFKYTMIENNLTKNEDTIGDLLFERQDMLDMENMFLKLYKELTQN